MGGRGDNLHSFPITPCWLQGGARLLRMPRSRPPPQLAASPPWHPLPARSCLHTLPAGPSPKPQHAQHPPRAKEPSLTPFSLPQLCR